MRKLKGTRENDKESDKMKRKNKRVLGIRCLFPRPWGSGEDSWRLSYTEQMAEICKQGEN